MILLLLALVPAAFLVLRWVVAEPFRALIVYAAVLPLGSSIVLPLGIPPPFDTLSTLIGALVGALLAWRLLVDPRTRARRVPTVTWIWLMFLAANMLTYLWSINRSKTLEEITVLAPLIALFVVASAYRASTDEIKWLDGAIIFGGAVAGLVALVMLLTGTLYPSGTGVDRFYASGDDPNITAASLQLPFAVALAWTIEKRGRLRLIGGVSAALIALGVILTVSRGGMLSLLVVITAWIIFTRRMRLLWVTLAVGVLTFAAIPDDVTERLTQTGSTGRTAVWEAGLHACPEYCLLGAGTGVFPEVHEETLVSDPTTTGIQLRLEAHNIFIAAALEVGVLGLVLLIAGLATTVYDTRWADLVHRRAALSGLAGVLMSNLLISNLGFKYFWLALTYATLVSARGRAVDVRRTERFGDPLAVVRLEPIS